DEDRPHRFRLFAEQLQGAAHVLELGRANVRTIGIAEIDEHVLAPEFLVRHRSALAVDELERASDLRLTDHGAVLAAAEHLDDEIAEQTARGDGDCHESYEDQTRHGCIPLPT